MAQTPQEKGKLSQFLHLNSPEALVLTAITPPPPLLLGEARHAKWVDECDIKIQTITNRLHRQYTQIFIQSVSWAIAGSRGTVRAPVQDNA